MAAQDGQAHQELEAYLDRALSNEGSDCTSCTCTDLRYLFIMPTCLHLVCPTCLEEENLPSAIPDRILCPYCKEDQDLKRLRAIQPCIHPRWAIDDNGLLGEEDDALKEEEEEERELDLEDVKDVTAAAGGGTLTSAKDEIDEDDDLDYRNISKINYMVELIKVRVNPGSRYLTRDAILADQIGGPGSDKPC